MPPRPLLMVRGELMAEFNGAQLRNSGPMADLPSNDDRGSPL